MTTLHEAPAVPSRSRTYIDDHDHVFHSWSAQATLDPIVVAGGSGSYFWDEAGKRYLDFSSQLVNLNLGHQHPAIVAAIVEKAQQLCTISPVFAEASRSQAADLIASHAPAGLNRVFFTNAGAEANEHAVRMARLTTGRPKVLSAYRSYHGGSALTMALTGDPRRWANDTGTNGVSRFFGPYLYRSPFRSETEAQECERALQHLADVIMLEGPQTIAAIILESVVGTNGILVPPPGYLAGVRALCDEHGIVFISDEVMSGFGRCGEWFAIDHWDVVPDLITFAKGVNSGYLPLGGVVINDAIADAFALKSYPGGLTYSGHVLACASAVGSMEAFEKEGLLDYVRTTGEGVVRPELEALAARHPSVGEVRGLGMFWAIELIKNPQTREPLVPFNAAGADAAPMAELIAACKARGLFPFTHFNRMHVVPPCNTSEDDLRLGLSIIDEVLELADAHVPEQAR
jgi:taurine--2-oxoglutarate transaminase